MNNIGYTFILGGRSHYLTKGIDLLKPIDEILSAEFIYEKSQILRKKVFEFDESVTADFTNLKGFCLGIVIFVGTWSADTILDEIYETKLKPSLINYFDNIDIDIPKKLPLEYRNMVYYEEYDVLVIVSIKAKTGKDMLSDFDYIRIAQELGIKHIQENGVNAPIHQYIISNGNINLEPILFTNLSEVNEESGVKIMVDKMSK